MSGLASGQRCPAQPQPAPCGAKTGATVYWGAKDRKFHHKSNCKNYKNQRKDFLQFLGEPWNLPAGVEWQKDRKAGSFDRNRFSLDCLSTGTSQMLASLNCYVLNIARTQKDVSQHNWLGCGCIPRKRSFITKIQIHMSFLNFIIGRCFASKRSRS